MWYIHTMKYYSAIKKNEIMPFVATWMDLDMVILSDRSHTERQIAFAVNYRRNLKIHTDELIYNTGTVLYM